jgi:prevent-host-death family protein
MTNSPKTHASLAGHWRLQDAKARFSELVRLARSEGPQHVTIHGREEVVVLSVAEFHRLRGDRTGMDLINAMQACPYPEVEFGTQGMAMPVRDVVL